MAFRFQAGYLIFSSNIVCFYFHDEKKRDKRKQNFFQRNNELYGKWSHLVII